MQYYLIEFEHDSKRLGYAGFDTLMIWADTFEEACRKVSTYGIEQTNNATGYKWIESYTNPRNFRNKTIR